MKALILAAGLGTRLRPITDTTPKPLVMIRNKPLLAYHLDALRKFGIREILINTHHLAKQIDDFISKYSNSYPEMQIQMIFEPELLGSAGTLAVNQKFFIEDSDLLVIYGDNFTNIDYTALANAHYANNGIGTIACYHEKHPKSKGIVTLDENNLIMQFVEKPKSIEITSDLANGGIYLFRKSIFEFLKKDFEKPYDFGKDVFPFFLKNNQKIYAHTIKELLLDIGTPENYQTAQKLIIKNK